jgi:hypothetical protein
MAAAVEVAPLEGLEEIEIDGTLYEAFNTSGGLGSLGETYGDRAQTMDYKTIRYPGHCAQMRLLMNDLKLNHDRATLKRVLENAVPQTLQDVVIVYVAVTGRQDGELREENYVSKIYPQVIAGRLWSAIQVTTAAGICAVVDLVLQTPGSLPRLRAPGGLRLVDVLANRFGRHYADGGSKDVVRAHGRLRPDRPAAHRREAIDDRRLLQRLGLEPTMRAPGAATAAGWRTTLAHVIDSVNPTTGEVIARVRATTPAQYEQVLASAVGRPLPGGGAGTEARRSRAPAGRGTAPHKAALGSLVSWRWARSSPRATAKCRR